MLFAKFLLQALLFLVLSGCTEPATVIRDESPPPVTFRMPADAQMQSHPLNASILRLSHPTLSASISPPIEAQLAELQASKREEAVARAFLQAAYEYTRLTATEERLRLRTVNRDRLGVQVRFDQYFNNMPVWPGEIQVNLTPELQVVEISGNYLPDPYLPIFPPVTDKSTVRASAAAAISQYSGDCQDCPLQPVIYLDRKGVGHAAFKATVSISQIKSWQVFVEAQTNVVLDVVSNVI